MAENIELTILMPCLNESETLATCIRKAKAWIARAGISAEVLVADNGSTDGSQQLATSLGARVVDVPQRGYGSALFFGSQAALGRYIIMGDSDDSYDFGNLDVFVEKLRQGFDLVMGNRFMGGIRPGAMPWKNRLIGNPLLTGIGRLLFRCPASDFHCGLRGYSKEAFLKMDLRTTGMEFASEMVIKANLFGMKICEVPTTLDKDGRSRPPHLRPWRDGWRHLRFMLLFSPRWLFVLPGAVLFGCSALAFMALLFREVAIGGVVFDVHTLLFAGAGVILGFLAICFGLIVRMFGIWEGLLPRHDLLEFLRRSPSLEWGGAVGIVTVAIGLLLGGYALFQWGRADFGPLSSNQVLRYCIAASTTLIMGGIIFMVSLILGFLSLPTRQQQ